MDDTETRAREYLVSLGFQNPSFEPDGNVPPDFVLDGRVAVEVQRLTQRSRSADNPGSLEELAIPLIERIQELAATFGAPEGEAWLLTLDFGRPIPPWRRLRPLAQAFLQRVRELGPGHGDSVQLHPNLKLTAEPGSPVGDEMFHLGITHDDDSGGWLGEELLISLRHSIEVKTAKVTPFADRYQEWWLVLLDHVTYARQIEGVNILPLPRPWKRVILVNPLDTARSIILQ